MNRKMIYGLSLLGASLVASAAQAQEPGWWGVVIADGPTQAQINRTDVRQRPYRPFHFYGNTVRRNYYRGNPLPTPRDVVNGTRALIQGPSPFPGGTSR